MMVVVVVVTYRVSDADRIRSARHVDSLHHCDQQRRRRLDLILVVRYHLRQER